MPEQFVLSCLLANRPVKVHWLPWQFNAIRTNGGGPVPTEAYIAHYHSPHRRPLEDILGDHLRRVMREGSAYK